MFTHKAEGNANLKNNKKRITYIFSLIVMKVVNKEDKNETQNI